MPEKTLSHEEKIDYIYTNLKKQESRRLWNNISKWGFRLALIGYIYYFFSFQLPNMIANLVPDIPEIPSASETLNISKQKLEQFYKNISQ